MALSIAVIRNAITDSTHVQIGWESQEQLQHWLLSCNGDESESVVAFWHYEGGIHASIFELVASTASDEYSLGRELQNLLEAVFEHGREFERQQKT